MVGSDRVRGEAQRTQLDRPSSTKQHIRRLNVPMDLVLGMKVVESEEEFAADDGDLGFGERTGFELFAVEGGGKEEVGR
jgi:hypothetical protein